MINYLEPNFSDLPGKRPVHRNYKRAGIACDQIDVSVITPYYNTGELFFETFVSLQAQSLQNWEWIIVDDGSPDCESVQRLADIAKTDQRIKVVRQKNGGTAAARNTGFSHSKGRYICLLDHDDMVEPTYLEKCAWFLDSNPEFAFCNSYNVFFGEQNFLWTTGFERGKGYLQANSAPPIAVIRRTAWVECGGFDASIRVLYEDWDFWLTMAKAGHWGYTIPEFLQWYRKLGGGRYEQILQSGYEHEEFARVMQQKYAGLDKHFPEPARRHTQPYETIKTASLVTNPLAANPSGRRIMFVVPWMVTGGTDRVNLDLIEGLVAKGHDITVCATLLTDHRWEHLYSHFTPDIFVLPNFLHASDYPRFLAYLIQSRQIDTVVITGSTIGYQLLPYLRAVSPNVAFVDMNHVEEPHWQNGGHPRFGVGYQDSLDLNIVTTQHLADWMRERGADGNRIRVMSLEGMVDEFSALVDEAHQLRIDHPRLPLSPNLGLELASQSLECIPLGKKDAAIEKLRSKGVALMIDSLVSFSGDGDLETVKLLIDAGVEVNAIDRNGNLALVQASWFGKKKVVMYLLDVKADVNGTTSGKLAALSAAVANLHQDVVLLLLERGANPNVVDATGSSPLITASWLGSSTLVKALLEFGAHTNFRRSSDGVTAIKAAVAASHHSVVKQLKAAGATE